MTVTGRSGHYLERPSTSGLADVIDLILDKGLVIDVYVRVSLVGIELLTIDARIVVASVDTYLRFAEAVNRLDLARSGTETHGLPELVGELKQGGAQRRTRGVLEGVKDKVTDTLGLDEDEDEESAERWDDAEGDDEEREYRRDGRSTRDADDRGEPVERRPRARRATRTRSRGEREP